MSDLFISFAEEDHERVQSLEVGLRSSRRSVARDVSSPPGLSSCRRSRDLGEPPPCWLWAYQVFEEDHFEACRQLGFLIGDGLFPEGEPVGAGRLETLKDVESWIAALTPDPDDARPTGGSLEPRR